MIIFLSHELLNLSHRIPRKIKNVAYRWYISILVLEILKFEKCVKYANERTDDVIHSIKVYKWSYLGQFAADTIETW